MSDLDFSGMFPKTPLEKAEERKRLHRVPHSLDVMLVTMVVLTMAILPVVWHFAGFPVAITVVVAVLLSLFLNQWYMYNAAYRDGFRSGYITAQQDHDEMGFIPDRVNDHRNYTMFGKME